MTDLYVDRLRRSRDELQRALTGARERGSSKLAGQLKIVLHAIQDAIGHEMGATAGLPISGDTRQAEPGTNESAEHIICAGVIVGVGGESDPCVTQEQADRATRLIMRELNRYGLLRPAMAAPDASSLLSWASALDGEAAIADRPGQMQRLENIAAGLRTVAAEAGWRPAVATDEQAARKIRVDELELVLRDAPVLPGVDRYSLRRLEALRHMLANRESSCAAPDATGGAQ